MYYILLPGDTEDDCIKDANQLGHISFGKFRPNDGFNVLRNIINTRPEMLDDRKSYSITIKDSHGKSYTVEEFLDLVGSVK